MVQVSPVLPNYLFALYLSTSLLGIGLCLLSIVAIYRTKKTPYPTKLLSIGLKVYNTLFLVSSNGGKFFDFRSALIFRHLCRGFMLAALFIVGFMSLERLFALNWPYIYLRVVKKGRALTACVVITVGSFLQYVLVRVVSCVTQDNFLYCSISQPAYYLSVCIGLLLISSASFIKIYRIIRNKSTSRTGLKEYKGTVISFLYLLNSTISTTIYLGISVYYTYRVATGEQSKIYAEELINVIDFIYLCNCILDPLVHTFWFKEARLEIMKVFSKLCPRLKPTVEQMRMEVCSIIPYWPDVAENITPSAGRETDSHWNMKTHLNIENQLLSRSSVDSHSGLIMLYM